LFFLLQVDVKISPGTHASEEAGMCLFYAFVGDIVYAQLVTFSKYKLTCFGYFTTLTNIPHTGHTYEKVNFLQCQNSRSYSIKMSLVISSV